MSSNINFIERNEKILNEHRDGHTFNDIAKNFKITRQRAQQIVVNELKRQFKKDYSNLAQEDYYTKLDLATREEIRRLKLEKKSKKFEEEKLKIEKIIKEKQLPLSNFFSVCNYSKVAGVSSAILSKYFPDIVRTISSNRKNKWSRQYNQCRCCGTVSIKHQSHGLCEKCYLKSDIWKELNESSRLRNYEKRKRSQQIYLKEYHKRPDVITRKRREQDLKFFGGNREKVLERDGFKCVICGTTQNQCLDKYKRGLYVRHIDRNPKNNEMSNLQTLCGGCFSLNNKRHNPDNKILKNKYNHKRSYDLESKLTNLSISKPGKNRVSPADFMRMATSYFGFSYDKFVGNSRLEEIALARQISMFLLKRIYNLSYPQIGKLFNRDHSTAIHGCKKIYKLIKSDAPLKETIKELEGQVYV